MRLYSIISIKSNDAGDRGEQWAHTLSCKPIALRIPLLAGTNFSKFSKIFKPNNNL